MNLKQLFRAFTSPTQPDVIALLNTVLANVGTLTMTIQEMKDALQTKLDKLTADTAANTTVNQSVVTLLQGISAQNASLKQQLADAIAAGGDASVLQPIADALDAQGATLSANTAALASAVTANTPAA